MRVANRLEHMPAYVFARLGRRIRELQAQGRDVIRLDIGSPDLAPPDFIIEALYRSVQHPDHHGYAGYYGTPALRQAMAHYYQVRFGVELDPDAEVVTLIGSKEGIANVALAFVDPGDLVLVPDPGYPTYSLGAALAGGKVHRVPLVAENGFLPDLDAISADVAQAARMLWLNYPNNPTAATAPLDFLTRAVDWARKTDTLLCHDAPYCDITYDGYTAPSMLQVPGAKDIVLEFNSLSKSHNMAGWRVGMAVGNPLAVEALARTKTNIDSGIFLPIQDAAVTALTADQGWLRERNEIYRARRDLILAGLDGMGIRARKPLASLYIWAETPTGSTSAAYADWLLEGAGVSVTPGTAFGPHGEGYLRISVGAATERVKLAMERWRALGG
jgi:LL-diaminopimelate aminotransferase